jgi:hypothetical protein
MVGEGPPAEVSYGRISDLEGVCGVFGEVRQVDRVDLWHLALCHDPDRPEQDSAGFHVLCLVGRPNPEVAAHVAEHAGAALDEVVRRSRSWMVPVSDAATAGDPSGADPNDAGVTHLEVFLSGVAGCEVARGLIETFEAEVMPLALIAAAQP